MEEKVNLRTFQANQHAVRIGDITYMPEAPSDHTFAGAHEVLLKRLDRLPTELAKNLARHPTPRMARMDVQSAARNAALERSNVPPRWFVALPAPYRREAEREWTIHNVEDPNIMLGFQFTGIGGYAIDLDRDRLIGKAYNHFKLGRLGGIRQLAWLTTPVLPQDQPGIIPHRFEHNRLCHMWDVAAIANLMAAGLGLPAGDAATVVLAASTHDARTPAGGDTTKLLDPAFFDEDARYGELLTKFDANAFLREFGIIRAHLIRTIAGEGLLGSILDVADKTAYVARDAYWFHQRLRSTIQDCEEGDAIHDLLRFHQRDACTAWQLSAIVDGKLVCTDPEALSRLLRLRALLFRALYHHPGSRFTEFIVSHVILKHLIESAHVSKDELLRWRDEDLDQFIHQYGHIGYGEHFGEPVHKGFDDVNSAMRMRDNLHASGEVCVMIETLPSHIKSGTHLLVSDEHGSARPLKEVSPDLADPIDALAAVVHPYRLYWVPKETLPAKILTLLGH